MYSALYKKDSAFFGPKRCDQFLNFKAREYTPLGLPKKPLFWLETV